MIATTRSVVSVNEPVVFVALELGKQTWKLGLTSGLSVPPWVQTVPSGDLAAVVERVAAARDRFALPATARVLCCYEAGRDGFWIHRALTARGIENRVVDSSSIEVNRRRRRAKSDRLDAQKLVILLARVCAGDRQAWSEVRVPSAADEAARHRSRERTALTQEHTRLRNQIGSWLATAGCVVSGRARHARRVVDDGPRLGGRAVARRRCKRGSRARAGAPGPGGRADRGAGRAATRRDARGTMPAVRTAGWCACAAWRRPVRRCSSRKASSWRTLSESAAARRAARVCAGQI